MLRLLIDDVTLVRDGELIRVHIRWKGGATTSLEVPRPRLCFELVRTPAVVIEEIRGLASEQADNFIACTLNGRDTKAARRSCPEELWRMATRKLEQLDAAGALGDLRVPPGNRLEALAGKRAGRYSADRTNEGPFSNMGILPRFLCSVR